jgi:CRP-like cAMP-binding protein
MDSNNNFNSDTYKYIFSVDFYNAVHPISNELKKFIRNRTRSMFLRKGDFVNKIGETCDKLMIIQKGMVRGFFEHGKREITTWVSYDTEMFTSISGYFKNEPAHENIQCIEDTTIEYLTYQDLHYCLKYYSEAKDLNRFLMEEYYMSAERRAFIARIPLAQARYDFYVQNTPLELLKRIPKKYLASLLNMQPETLARIRTKKPKN